ncbi:ornithine carbamoyltransferase [Streptomyces anulatus]
MNHWRARSSSRTSASTAEAGTRSLITLSTLDTDEFRRLGETAHRFGEQPDAFAGDLEGARVGLLFTAPSTRTKTSFWSAGLTLGCSTLHLGAAELQVSTGETWADTGMVLAHYLDAAVVRTNGPQEELARFAARLPATVNAVTREEHPTQAVADLCALREHFGSAEGLRVAYLGEANNTARSLAHLTCLVPGMVLDAYTPEGYGFGARELREMNAAAGREAISQRHVLPDTPPPVDAVYTTRWQSMGVLRDEPEWRSSFLPFRVTEKVMERFSGRTEAVFMHDLPATRDEEVTSWVLDSRLSLVGSQARHKTSAAAAALLRVLAR